jgi:hypothetical protein
MSENSQPIEQPVDPAPQDVVGAEAPAAPTAETTEPLREPGKDETPPWLKAEITKERNKRRAAEEAARIKDEQIERLTRALGERTQDKPSEGAQKPRREDFFDPDEYEAAKDAWLLEQAEKRLEEKSTRSSQEQAQARAIEETRKAWSAQAEAAKKAHPDFDEVVYSDDFQCSAVMMNAIVADVHGAEVAYHLGQNPDEASRIAALPPVQQIIEIGRLSATLQARPAAVSRAPAPISPLGNEAPALRKSPDEESMEEFAARRAAEAKAKGEKLF